MPEALKGRWQEETLRDIKLSTFIKEMVAGEKTGGKRKASAKKTKAAMNGQRQPYLQYDSSEDEAFFDDNDDEKQKDEGLKQFGAYP